MFNIRNILCASLVLAMLTTSAQRKYHVNTNNGLCTNSLTDLTKDSYGNMWIGSYGGLMKYSGSRILCFDEAGTNERVLSSLEMHSVWEDKCGFIWAATTGGLDKIDPVTHHVTHYILKPMETGASSVGYYYSVFQDREEFIWCSTDAAVFRIDNNTGQYEVIPIRQDKSGIPNHTISYNGFLEGKDGFWFHTADGLSYYEYATRLFYHRYHNPDEKPIFDIKKKEAFGQSDMDMDSKGNIWFVNNHTQLVSYHPDENRMDTISFKPPAGTWPCCYSVAVDKNDNIWVGTRHGGIFILNTSTRTFTHLRNTGINGLIQSDYIYTLEKGIDGQMFVAHDNGLDVIDLYDVSLRERKLSGEVDFLNLKYQAGDLFLHEAEQQVYIPFFDCGFFTYDLLKDRFMQYGTDGQDARSTLIFSLENKNYLSQGSNIFPFESEDERLKIGTQGILTEEVARVRGIPVWFYQENPNSVYVKKSSGRLIHWTPDTMVVIPSYGFKPNVCLSRDSHSIYNLTPGLNLIRRDLKSATNDTILLQQMLDTVQFSFANPRHILDDGASIWMTGQNGILRYQHVNNTLSGYTMEKGLSHGFNFAVVQDKKGDIWVGNLGGIDRYDKEADRFVSILKVKETSYMDAFGHAVCGNDGRLVFHFGNKLYVITPDSLHLHASYTPRLQLHEVIINGVQVDWRNTDVLHNLRYDENRITFTYDFLRFGQPDLIRFKYRLNDGNWISLGSRTEVNFNALTNGRYVLDISTDDAHGSPGDHVLTVPFTIKSPFWKTWWFISACLALVTAIVWIMIRRHLRSIQNQNRIEIQIAELKSTALRAQMNPHFVFNCLNAIQECVVTGRIDEAYTYLSRFSRLLRLVLEHSDFSAITLHQELEILNLYISLEKLRFREAMEVHIQVDDEIESEQLYIPPMLIQPHIENAIWHGLRHREGDKRLIVDLQEEAEYLHITIEDNGIGRIKAQEIKASRMGAGQRHTSKGLDMCRQRITLLQKQYPKTHLEIADLYNEGGIPIGTKVSMLIPLIPRAQAPIHPKTS